MKRIVIIYGIIAGFIAEGFLWVSVLLWQNGYLRFENFDYGVLIGYATMLVALSMVFFGVRAYRDSRDGVEMGFWKAFQMGMLISLIASVIYASGWEVYMQVFPGFMEQYIAGYLDKLRVKGTPQAEIDAAMQSMASMQEMYRNPVFRFGFSLSEILPVGIIVSFLTAAILRRKPASLRQQPA